MTRGFVDLSNFDPHINIDCAICCETNMVNIKTTPVDVTCRCGQKFKVTDIGGGVYRTTYFNITPERAKEIERRQYR